jgi:hypothetical protein
MQIADVNGHIVILICTLPLIFYMTKIVRGYRIEQLMTIKSENFTSDIDTLIFLSTI